MGVVEVLNRDPGAPASIYPSKALGLFGKNPRNLSRFPLQAARNQAVVIRKVFVSSF